MKLDSSKLDKSVVKIVIFTESVDFLYQKEGMLRNSRYRMCEDTALT